MKIRNILITLMLTLIIITSVGSVSAISQKTVVSEELIQSQYGTLGVWLDAGDRLYKVTYDDGSTSYRLARSPSNTLFLGSVNSAYTIPVGGTLSLTTSITGISSIMDGAASHTHELRLWNPAIGNLFWINSYDVPSGQQQSITITVGPMNTPGTSTVKLEEKIYMANGVQASGDNRYFTLTVGNPTSTPAPTYSTPVPTSQPVCSAGYTYTNGRCAPSQTPPSSQPTTTVVQLIQNLLGWLKGLFGLSILGASDVSIGAGAQSFVLTTVATENPDNDYSDGSYSELWGTWMIVDSSQNIVAQKGSWLKLSSSTYSDTATYTFANKGSYALVSVIIKVPYTYSGTQWTKGTEAIIGQDKLGVGVKTPAPGAATNPSPPASSLGSILSSLYTWFKSLFGL